MDAPLQPLRQASSHEDDRATYRHLPAFLGLSKLYPFDLSMLCTPSLPSAPGLPLCNPGMNSIYVTPMGREWDGDGDGVSETL